MLTQIQTLPTTLVENQRCHEQYQLLTAPVDELYHDFREFEKEYEAKSELCRFLGVWLQLVAVIKNVIVSDRERNWDLHVATIGDSVPTLAECDSFNYLYYRYELLHL